MFEGRKLWQISHQKLLASKILVNSCLFAFFIYAMKSSYNLDGKLKVGKPSVICQTH